jgi:hypothetical protein
MHRIMVLYMLVIISVLLCGVVQACSSVVACYPPEDGLRTETRVGEYIDINKNYKVVYVCAFVGW